MYNYLVPQWLQFLSTFLFPYKKNAILGMVCSCLARICDLIPLAIVGYVVNSIAQNSGDSVVYLGYGFLVFLAFAGIALFQSSSDFQLALMAQGLRHDVRMRLFSHIIALDAGFFNRRKKGDLLSVLTGDVDTLNSFVSETLSNSIRVVVTFVGTYAYLFWLDYRLALLLTIPLPLVFIAMSIFAKRIRPQYLRTRRAVGDFAGVLENSLQGMNTLQAYCAESRQTAILGKESLYYRDTAIEAADTRRKFVPVIYGVAGLSFGLLIGVGAWLTTTASGPSIGAYTTFVLMTTRLIVPIFTLSFLVNQFQQARAACTRIREISEEKTTIADLPDAIDIGREVSTVEFKDICFRNDEKDILEGINISLKKGDFIGIVGETGAGKSTIVKLLLRFLEPSVGEVRVNNKNIEEVTLHSLRCLVGYVSQEPFLFHGTIADNIRLGAPDASFEELEQAAMAAGIYKMIEELPDGYQTLIGAGGNGLSGGQKQRISLARALLKKPPILILDEATSAVDNLTEKNIQQTVLAQKGDRITIAIAHRLTTLTEADHILVLDSGKIIECGDHKELLAHDGKYAEMWNART